MEEKACGGGAFDTACAVTVSGRLWKCGTCCTEKEIRGTISVASNISQQDMQQYLDGFNKKYPGIEVKYQSYSDYDNEVSNRFRIGIIRMFYLFRDRCREHLRQERTAVSVCNHGY